MSDRTDSMWREADALDAAELKLTGLTKGGITVLHRLADTTSKNGKKYDRWQCQCIHCGNLIEVSGGNIRRDDTQRSCGCLLPTWHRRYRAPRGRNDYSLPRIPAQADFSI